jgi:hypothetical protein
MNLVIVNSVIRTAPQPLSYAIRSYFTHEQRYQQTLDTIHSIREKIPQSYIVLIEGSTLSVKWEEEISKRVDYYFNISLIPEVKNAINSPAKGYGEQMKLLTYLQSSHFREIYPYIDSITKLCGRYRLTEKYQHIRENVVCIKQNDNDSMNTTWYYLPKSEIMDYIRASSECITNPFLLQSQLGIEYILFQTWLKAKKTYRTLPTVGVEGWVGPFGDYFVM